METDEFNAALLEEDNIHGEQVKAHSLEVLVRLLKILSILGKFVMDPDDHIDVSDFDLVFLGTHVLELHYLLLHRADKSLQV